MSKKLKTAFDDIKKIQEKLRHREKELKIVYQVVQAVSSLDFNQVLKEIVKTAVRVTKGDSCLVYVLDPKRQELVLRASKNPHSNLLRKIKMKLGEGITGWVAKEKKIVAISENAAKDPRFKFFRSLPEDRFQAFLSVPILKRQKLIGVINIQHKDERVYSASEKRFLSAIGKLVGGAVENARLVEESLRLRNALETRKIVEKAKGILMEGLKISEEKAYEEIRKQSMKTRKSSREIAQAIILTQKFKKSKS